MSRPPVNPQRQIRSPPRGQEVCSAAWGEARGSTLNIFSQPLNYQRGDLGLPHPGHPSSESHEAASPKGKLPGSSINVLGMWP